MYSLKKNLFWIAITIFFIVIMSFTACKIVANHKYTHAVEARMDARVDSLGLEFVQWKCPHEVTYYEIDRVSDATYNEVCYECGKILRSIPGYKYKQIVEEQDIDHAIRILENRNYLISKREKPDPDTPGELDETPVWFFAEELTLKAKSVTTNTGEQLGDLEMRIKKIYGEDAE